MLTVAKILSSIAAIIFVITAVFWIIDRLRR